jgi:hypothetical protein
MTEVQKMNKFVPLMVIAILVYFIRLWSIGDVETFTGINGVDYGMTDNQDSTLALQKAVDAAVSKNKPLYIPKGTYILDSKTTVQIKIPPGQAFTLFGDGPQTVFKRKDKSATMDGQEMFYIQSTIGDVPKVELYSFTIDGNARQNPLPSGTIDDYLWQHTASFKIKGSTHARIKEVLIHDITAFDPIADHFLFPGTSNSYVEKARINNFLGTDRNRSRSDITVTGGLHELVVENSTATRIETELNTPYDNGVFQMTVSNTVITSQLDIMGKNKSNGQVTLNFTGNNIIGNDLKLHMISGAISNSTFVMSNEKMTRINNLKGFLFDNITFKAKSNLKGQLAPLTFYAYEGNDVTIRNSVFNLDSTDPNESPGGYMIQFKAFSTSQGAVPVYRIINSKFDSRLQSNIYADRSGNVVLEKNYYSGSLYSVRANSETSKPLNLTIRDGDNSMVSGKFLQIDKNEMLVLDQNLVSDQLAPTENPPSQ